MRIYISGKITGTKDYMERFKRAEMILRMQGHSVVNPAAVNSALPKDTAYEDYMRISFAMLFTCDTIYMLKGWQESSGANREYAYAKSHGMRIIEEKPARLLTHEGRDGTWGLTTGNIENVPDWLYEYICRLHDYEKLGVTPEQLEEIDRLYADKCKEISELEKKNGQQYNSAWIPVEERFPDKGKYILLSFENYTMPAIGRWEEDKNGGAFYIGDSDSSCVSCGIIVNAWMYLPECYQEYDMPQDSELQI